MNEEQRGEIIPRIEHYMKILEEMKLDLFQFCDRSQIHLDKSQEAALVARVRDGSFTLHSRLRKASEALEHKINRRT